MPEARRERLWLALSELWLDSRLAPSDLDRLARVMADSGLSRAELEAVYLYEVAPRVWLNQWTPAGVWDGFEPAWLMAGCRRNRQRRAGCWFRWACRLCRWPLTQGVAADWQQLLARLKPEAGDRAATG